MILDESKNKLDIKDFTDTNSSSPMEKKKLSNMMEEKI
jgi:hypothetical protein